MTRAGGWLWRLVTFGVSVPVSEKRIDRATDGGIAALYAALSKDQRANLSAVPGLAARLERRALDAGDPHQALAAAALDSLRLDLIRLRAGDADAVTLTGILQRVREIDLRVDDRVLLDAIDPLADS